MIYSTFKSLKLSALGLGAMRLPTKDGVIDKAHTAEMFDYAIKNGVNYFDTAWGYHDGESELVTGEILSRYPRESFFLASKFPGYDLSNMGKVEEIFEKQLEKCRVDYFDFYLVHNVCELNIDSYLDDEKYGALSYLIRQKENGRIRHLGFSAHGNVETITRFLDAYGDHMEFGQLQLNWLDWDFQDSRAKAELLSSRNIPVWVMEPLRGGNLCTLSDAHAARLCALRPDETIPGWAFRFLQSIPGVTMTLSGMSSLDQLRANIETYSENKPLSDAEMSALMDIAREMTAKIALPCTSCRYCTTHCPMGLDIPWLIELYNEHCFSGGGFIAPMALNALPEEKRPSACLSCRACEAVCPQQIKISEALSDFAEKLK